MHWSQNYIGKPWKAGAKGPDCFDCWGLLWHVYKYQKGIELPFLIDLDSKDPIAVNAAFENQTVTEKLWVEIETPEELCGVAIGRRYYAHVGVYTSADGGLIIHAVDNHNVLAQRPGLLAMRGYLRYYKHGTDR